MDVHDLTEQIERVRIDLEHRRRSRTTVERSKVHITHDIDQARRELDRALQVARRAQDEVEDAQRKLDEAMKRMHQSDTSLEQIAQEELELAAQLRDLSHDLSKGSQNQKNISGSKGDSHLPVTGRAGVRTIR